MSSKKRDPQKLLQGMLGGDRVALARLITLVENRTALTSGVMSQVFERCGSCRIIGITGPPGAGKSTITSCLIEHLRADGQSVGIVAIDPSSPFTGGAVLGDRIRMQKHFLDPEVFIRSLSTRGTHGGLARCGRDVARLFDAFGKDVVIIETVGVGQTELDIMEVADTVIVVLVPESGDTVQVMKAGLLEIADVFVVNKADRDGATRMQTELKMMLGLKAQGESSEWRVPVLLSQASRGKGTEEILRACLDHGDSVAKGAISAKRSEALKQEVLEICEEEMMQRLRLNSQGERIGEIMRRVGAAEIDPYKASLEILGSQELLIAALAKRG